MSVSSIDWCRRPGIAFDNWIDGELSDVRYFAIGDSCSSSLDSPTDLHNSSDNGRCECLDGFSGEFYQEDNNPTEPISNHEQVCQNIDCASDFDHNPEPSLEELGGGVQTHSFRRTPGCDDDFE